MGYSEVSSLNSTLDHFSDIRKHACNICQVSFNIGRIRTVNEPLEAARAGYGGSPPGSFVNVEYAFHDDREQTSPGLLRPDRSEGCFAMRRQAFYDKFCMCPVTQKHDSTPTGSVLPATTRDNGANHKLISLDTWNDLAKRGQLQESCQVCNKPYQWEHVAGLKCQCASGGYNGNNINIQEMKGCRTAQFLVPKTGHEDWHDEGVKRYTAVDDDDEDFECKGAFFLSGLCENMPSYDMDIPYVFPQRHGCSAVVGSKPDIWDDEELEQCALTFHPTCLEVYKRVSLWRSGQVDIDGLISWYFLTAAGCDDHHWFTVDPAVRNGGYQFWEHHNGDEFLVANPCFIPGLEHMIQAVSRLDGTETILPSESQTSISSTGDGLCRDKFSELPIELLLHIITYLDIADLVALRQVSRNFHNLPSWFFMNMILDDKPWFWEAWCTRPYSRWSTSTVDEEKTGLAQYEEQLSNIDEHALSVVGFDEDYERAFKVLSEQKAQLYKSRIAERKHGIAPLSVHHDRTDWYSLVVCLHNASRTGRLKGLRNRERIWNVCNGIFDAVEYYRAYGTIKPGEVVNLRAIFEAARDREDGNTILALMEMQEINREIFETSGQIE